MKSIKGKMLAIYGMVFLALFLTVVSAFIAVDTQQQHLILTELLSKQKLLVERVTFSTINTAEIGLANPSRFKEKSDENSLALNEYQGAVDFMLQAFEDKEYPIDGKIVKLKFRDDFLVIFDDALSKSKANWVEIKKEITFLLEPENLTDMANYEIQLDKFRLLNTSLIENSDYLTHICRVEASRKSAISNGIQFASVTAALLIFFWMIFTMNRDFRDPLAQIQGVFSSMKQGQFHLRLDRKREDEFKTLFEGFNHFADSLQTIRSIEARILREDSIYEVLTFIKESFRPYVDFETITLFYKNSTSQIVQLEIANNELVETVIESLEKYDSIQKLDENNLVLPIEINQAYIGYAKFSNSHAFDASATSFLEALNQTLSFAFYKSLLFKDLLSIVTNALSDLAESRDPETRLHLTRMSKYSQIVARKLRENPNYTDAIDNEFLTSILLTAPMHDIGKVSVPDDILLKPGKLTDDEFFIMKTHALEGSVVLRKIHDRFEQFNLDYFDMAADIALCHQEKFNGSGYPNGIEGSMIPLSARISAIADVFDALTSKRPYKEAFSLEKSYSIINDSVGSHFDPDVVEAFFAAQEEIERIYHAFKEV